MYFQPVYPPNCPLYKQDPIDNTPPDHLSNFFSSKPQQLEIRIICPSVRRPPENYLYQYTPKFDRALSVFQLF